MRSSRFFLALATLATAKTDLSGCTSSDVIAYGGASVLWYVPGTGEICSFLDCGGGMAPPMTTVPGCPEYSGTATYSPSFLPGFKDGSAAAVSSTANVAATSTSPLTAMITGPSSTNASPSETGLSGFVSSSSPVSSGSVSITTSTGSATESMSTSSVGIKSSGSSSASSGTASSSSTSNAASSNSAHVLAHGIIGAAAAGFAFLL